MPLQAQLHRPLAWWRDHQGGSAPLRGVQQQVLHLHFNEFAAPGLHVQQEQDNRRGAMVHEKLAAVKVADLTLNERPSKHRRHLSL